MINLKKYNKPIVVLILASVLLCSAFVGVAFGFLSGQSVNTNRADYVTVEGVAGTDYYGVDYSRQYCYFVNQWAFENGILGNDLTAFPSANQNPLDTWFSASKSLRVGMTEFGEFATPANTGVAYGNNAAEWVNTESWASTGIPNAALYIQGWTFYMDYMRAGLHRAFEGYAIFSDMSVAEGGRKVYSWWGDYAPGTVASELTLGSLSASGVQVLYDSARLVVVRTSTTLHDAYYNEDVAKVTLTLVFNKDTKYAIVYKDVKILLDTKVLDIIYDFAFSERYEIDVARIVNPSNRAYVHYYANYNETVYTHPLTGQKGYDVVQAFDPAKQFIFFAAYWPQTTQYAVYSPLVPDLPHGFTRNLPYGTRGQTNNTEIADIPASGGGEPNTPWVIAQWRYQQVDANNVGYAPKLLGFLAKDPQREIRFVEVFGMTDYNAGSFFFPGNYGQFVARDANATALQMSTNYVDLEVQYTLDYKVFNPLDLSMADSSSVSTQNNEMMWLGLGQSAATTDSAGAVAMADFENWGVNGPLGLFDRNDTAFPWALATNYPMKGTIPYALDNDNANFTNYLEAFSNVAWAKGNDATTYVRTGLNGFVFNYYDGMSGRNPEPIAGGMSSTATGALQYWYPSKCPLTERWTYNSSSFAFAPAAYDLKNQSGFISLGGEKANGITRYFNDFNTAITREGPDTFALVNGGVVTGTAPTSNPALGTRDFYPISSWNSGVATFGYQAGTAVISICEDINGSKCLSVYGWDARDTYWASNWASQYIGEFSSWLPAGATSLVLSITYSSTVDREPTAFTVVKALGTITEFGTNAFITEYATFDAALSTNTWTSSLVAPPALPGTKSSNPEGSNTGEWWYAKLPTSSTAKVEFDP